MRDTSRFAPLCPGQRAKQEGKALALAALVPLALVVEAGYYGWVQPVGPHGEGLAGTLDEGVHTDDVEGLLAAQPEVRSRGPIGELSAAASSSR